MAIRRVATPLFLAVLIWVAVMTANAQSFRVQCPTSTITHPAALANVNAEPTYTGPTVLSAPSATTYQAPVSNVNGAIKCQQISGGDGYATMGDGTQTYMFSFGPLSGLVNIANGLPGTTFPSDFNNAYDPVLNPPLQPGDPATTNDANPGTFTFNGAVGLAKETRLVSNIYDIAQMIGNRTTVVVQLNAASGLKVGDTIVVAGTGGAPPAGYDGTWTVNGIGFPRPAPGITNYAFPNSYVFTFDAAPYTGLGDVLSSSTASVATTPELTGHVDPRQIMDVAVMNGNIPAPMMAIDEDDEFFLTLTNVGMIMRPDLFEQHTVHFHGYPNASSFYDGVPDASVAINIGGSFTYYYLAPDAGTYFWHCHITPPEHLQMGMVGQLYVRPRQNRVALGGILYNKLQAQQTDPRTACPLASDTTHSDILCSNPLPASNSVPAVATIGNCGTNCVGITGGYAYNDGDGSTYYDVEYPLQIHGFDPNFHFVGMTFNPEGFTDMKDKYFLLNGRSYPDTVFNGQARGPMETASVDGVNHFSQPLSSRIDITAGQKALLRISCLDVSEYQTLASLGIPMKVIGFNAKLLRDQAGNNLYYNTNSITLGGGESLDVILDSTGIPPGTYYLYTSNLDHLSNDAENFGGLMTEVHVN